MSRFFALSILAPGLFARERDTSDLALVERARAKEASAFRVLFDRHGQAVWRFLRDVLGDESLADEGVQETFIRAFDRIDSLENGARLLPWLLGIARNVAFELQRARRRDRERGEPHDDRALEDVHDGDASTPEVVLLGRETEAVMSRALESLSTERRAALLMRVDHGLGYDEIARAMGWNIPKVKNEIHRARLQLRNALVRYDGGEP
ncbi:MAG: RNA polymerase sigma factor [Myxococcaceae bacterium]